MCTVGIIPARSGSKGIPGKNLKLVEGKPLIQYTIDEALKSKLDFVVVTSDCPEILNFSEKCGIRYLRKRPSNLATDTANMVDTIEDVLDWLAVEKSILVNSFVLLQPTSPLRTFQDIDDVLDKSSPSVKSIISVCLVKEHPCEIVETGLEGGWKYLVEDMSSSRRQDYHDSFYFINGAIYLRGTDVFRDTKTLIDKGSEFHVMPRSRSVDVDEPVDLALVEFYLRELIDA